MSQHIDATFGQVSLADGKKRELDTEVDAADSKSIDDKKRETLTQVIAIVARFRKTMRSIKQIYKDAIAQKPGAATNPETKDTLFKLESIIGVLESVWLDETKKMPNLSKEADQTNTAGLLYTSTNTYRLCNIFTWGVWHLIVNVRRDATPEFKEHVAELMATREQKPWPIEIIFEKMFKSRWMTYHVSADKRASYSYTTAAPSPLSPEYTFSGLQMPTEWNKAGLFYQSGIPFGAMLEDIRSRITSDTPTLSPIQGTEYISGIVFCYYDIICIIMDYYDAINEYHILMKTGKKEARHNILFEECFKESNSSVTWAQFFREAREQAESRANAFLKRDSTDVAHDMFGTLNANDFSQGQLKDLVSRVAGLNGFDPSTLLGDGGLSGLLGNLTSALSSDAKKTVA